MIYQGLFSVIDMHEEDRQGKYFEIFRKVRECAKAAIDELANGEGIIDCYHLNIPEPCDPWNYVEGWEENCNNWTTEEYDRICKEFYNAAHDRMFEIKFGK